MAYRILHIITRLDQGGAAINTIDVVRGLAERGKYEPVLMAGSISQLEDGVVEEIKSVAGLVVEGTIVRDPSPVNDLQAWKKVKRYLREGHFDLIHTHTSKAGFVGRLASRGLGVPVVHSTHGHIYYGYFGKAKTRLFVEMEKLAAGWCDRIVCATRLEVEDHLRNGVGEEGKFRVIGVGVDVERFRGGDGEIIRRELGIGDEEIVIGGVGRLTVVKGFEYLVRGFLMMRSEHKMRLVIAGEGEDREKLRKIVADAGVGSGDVAFLGQRNDVPDVLAAMDIVVVPSLNEGFGKVIVEAMSGGRAIVATRVGGIPELVEEGVTGLLVEPGSGEAIAEAVGRLVADGELAAMIGRNAMGKIDVSYGVSGTVERIEAMYDEMLGYSG